MECELMGVVHSILFAGGTGVPSGVEDCPLPGFFVDLNLDQFVAAVIGKDEHRLAEPVNLVESVC